MVPFLRRGFFTVALGAAVTLMPHVTCGEEKDTRDGAGIVWFVGSVLKEDGEQAIIDLGDAHGLHDGDEVAIFRARDDHFRPLGTTRVKQSLATWSIPATSIRFEPETGDRVIYLRTLSQLGTAESFLDGFLRMQVVKTAHRNGYSTVQQLEEADVLERFVLKQPRWQRNQEHIAGTIRSASISQKDLQEMKPLLAQVLKFQDYRSLGVSIEPTAGAEWLSVSTTLTPVTVERFDSIEKSVNEADATAPAAGDNPVGDNPAGDSGESMKNVAAIRRHVEELLFLRSREERIVVTMICAALEISQPRNERQWYSLQLRNTQFVALADDKQLLDEFELVMRRVRAEE